MLTLIRLSLCLPTVACALLCVILVAFIYLCLNPDSLRSLYTEQALSTASEMLEIIKEGLNERSAQEICQRLLPETRAMAIAVTDDARVLACVGELESDFPPGSPIHTPATRYVLEHGVAQSFTHMVDVPSERGLVGHSDADVVAHALMDAVLGAMRAGDIGKLFPDTDPAYEGADSLVLMRRVAELVRERGWRVVDVDCTVAAQAPKLAPYREQMRANMAAALGVPVDAVGVKATTTERLGFVGREEGIAAWAVALLERAE